MTRKRRLAVIIPAMNEADTLPAVLQQIRKLHPYRIVVVVNGSHDDTAAVARANGARVVRHNKALGNDVGRAIGAFTVDADTYLFTDADLAIPTEELRPFVEAIENGTDLALNGLDWLTRFPKPDEPSIARYFNNMAQRRRDLGLENALTVPHAISRHALDVIGKDALADPLLATCIAIDLRLKVEVVNYINVLEMNKYRRTHGKKPGEIMSKAYQRMHGDSIEALNYILKKYGKRGGFAEGRRHRELFASVTRASHMKLTGSATRPLSIILSVTRQSLNLAPFLKQLKEFDAEIIAVLHDGGKHEYRVMQKYGIPCLEFAQYLGRDVAFAIGSTRATGEHIIFHDTCVPVDADELLPFILDLQAGKAQVVLNDHARYMGKLEGMHSVHIGNWYMNIVAGRPDLATSSLVLPPFGMQREALMRLHPRSLLNPSRAQLEAIRQGLTIATSGSIDYLERIKHSMQPVVLDEEQIIGDMLEGLHYWIKRYGYRGGFTDMGRRRYKLKRYGGTTYYRTDSARTRSI